MTKIIKICDKCGKEVKWLYEIPEFRIEGLNINIYNGSQELCEHCARKLVEMIKNYDKGGDK